MVTFGANAIATLMTVMAAIVSIIGTNAMKYSHTKNSKLPPDEQVVYFMRCDWWLAFTGVAFGGMSDFFAMGLSSQVEHQQSAVVFKFCLLARAYFVLFSLDFADLLRWIGGSYCPHR